MTQLQVDFNPAVVATDYVHEVISTSYLSNNLRTLFMNHTIEMTSILSVVSWCCHSKTIFIFEMFSGGSHLKFHCNTRVLPPWLRYNEDTSLGRTKDNVQL